jgi:hypothetical protein
MKRSRPLLLPIALSTAIVLGAPCTQAQSTPSHAAPPAAAPLSDSLTGPARDAYNSARILINNGDFAGAYSKYAQAYSLSKDPRLLYDMAVCTRSMKAYARMQSLLVRYQHEGQATMSAEDRTDVTSALAAIHDLVGTVKLSVTEAGATVAVDGAGVGTTPLADPLAIDLGPHTLTVKKPGFVPVEQALTIEGGSETALAVTLEVETHVAQLVVSADDGAMVVIDDQAPAKGRFDGQLPAGTHDVRVSEPGKVAYRVQVELRDGETRTVQVTLENEKHGPTVWPWIVGGATVVAGAVVGGYFLFKSSPASPATPPDQLGSIQTTAWGR